MGSNGIQRPPGVGGQLHEPPAVGDGGVYRWEEYGGVGDGVDKVSFCGLRRDLGEGGEGCERKGAGTLDGTLRMGRICEEIHSAREKQHQAVAAGLELARGSRRRDGADIFFIKPWKIVD